MRVFTWDVKKNEKLKQERGIAFDEIVYHIGRGDLLDILKRPNQQRCRG